MTLPDLEGMTLFVKIVEHGSLSAAARGLGLPKATVSRRLAQLESRLNVRLLNRSTRRLSLTDHGAGFHRRCASIVEEAEALEAEMLASTGVPTGRVRVAAPIGLGHVLLMPLLTDFLKRHSRVALDLDFADRRFDIVAEGFDVAFRLGPLEDSSLIARRAFTYRRLLVASPDYLRNAPPLESVQDLTEHNFVLVSPASRDIPFLADGSERLVRVASRMAVRNILLVRDAVVAGHGIAVLPDYVAASDMSSGRLVSALDHVAMPAIEASLVYPQARNRSVAVARFIDHCLDGLRATGNPPSA